LTSERALVDPPKSEPGPRVLLIDDDESILKIIGKALTASDCDVETADSARDAAMLLARGDYDAIISDIRMPNFDGTQLFQFLEKHLPDYKNRVIFLTGDTGNPATLEFLEKTGAPYLTKPIEIDDLLRLLRTVTSKQAS
jgi:DNA-binding response OmpR family regulator